ncbi:NAD(P)-dependent oxidoreductase [Streptomyces sp. NPDC005859]|uniref:NAD(P)-dependent oxidoreductase n=1 Tax=Streptomyces sp. NPDC005859 TaxID=3157170 RepID=UPI0033CD4204
MSGSNLVPEEVLAYVRSRGYETRHAAHDHFSPSELDDLLDGARGYLIGGYESATAENFERATTLEAAAFVGTDYKAYVAGWSRAHSLGIALVHAAGANAVSVAELTVSLILAMSRSLCPNPLTPESKETEQPSVGTELHGKRLGIIGLGRIGGRVARAASLGLGMEVVYHAPERNIPTELQLGVEYCPREELFRTCEVISLHRPGPLSREAPEVGRRELELVRPSCVLINAAHPRLVDLDALLWAVREKAVRCAFDGVATGPSWQPLLELGTDRFLALPAMGHNTFEANLRASRWAAEALCDVLDGGGHRLVSNPDFRRVRRAVRR